MKFWQLTSITSENRDLIERVAKSDAAWSEYGEWASNLESIVQRQDRAILDRPVRNDFVFAVLNLFTRKMYVSHDGRLRSRSLGEGEEVISVSEAVRRYGGDAVEDALEYGSAYVTR